MTKIFVDRIAILRNSSGDNLPVFIIQGDSGTRSSSSVKIKGPSRLIFDRENYRNENPVVWIETEAEVETV